MKITEQKQHEAEMKLARLAFRKLWLDQLTWISAELVINTPDIKHIAWQAFLGGIAQQKISENSCCKNPNDSYSIQR